MTTDVIATYAFDWDWVKCYRCNLSWSAHWPHDLTDVCSRPHCPKCKLSDEVCYHPESDYLDQIQLN